MRRDLLAWLACPDCGADLRVAIGRAGPNAGTEGSGPNAGTEGGGPNAGTEGAAHASEEVIEGRLSCPQCSWSAAIAGGIPRFAGSDGYADSFSFEWRRFATTQLDSAHGGGESEERLRENLDFPLEHLHGKLVLDAGCGMGRFAEIAAKYGATVVAADLSYAVEPARRNLSRWPAAHVIQADLRRLPLKDGIFDLVYSLGVLHHTPDPRRSFEGLIRYLRPGGRISITLYSGYNKVYVTSTNLWRRVTTRLPARAVYALSHLAIPLYHLYRVPVVGLVGRALWPISLHPNPQWRLLDTFDCYTPRYQFFFTHPEVYRWFREAGLEDIAVLEPGVSFIGTRASLP